MQIWIWTKYPEPDFREIILVASVTKHRYLPRESKTSISVLSLKAYGLENIGIKKNLMQSHYDFSKGLTFTLYFFGDDVAFHVQNALKRCLLSVILQN